MIDVAFKIFIITNCLFWSFWLNIVKFEVNLCYRYCSNLFRNLRKESEFWQYHYSNSTKVGERKRKSGIEKFLIFGNTIIEIPFAHTCCPNGCSKCECTQGKPNVTMALPKQGKKIGNCGNAIVENGEKKKIVVAEITCEEF